MRNAAAMALRILQQFRHDPRTVVMFVVAPILVLWLFSVLLGSSAYLPKLAGVGLPEEVSSVLRDQEADFQEVDGVRAEQMLANQEIDAILTLDDGILHVQVEGTDASHTGAVVGVVSASVQEIAASQRQEATEKLVSDIQKLVTDTQKLMQPAGQLPPSPTAGEPQPTGQPPTAAGPQPASPLPSAPEIPDITDLEPQLLISEVEVDYLHGSDEWNLFDFSGPVFIGIFIFVFVFITSGMSLISERTGGTMERLLATPIKPWQLVLGFCLGFGLVSLVQAAIVLWASITLVGFPNEGSILTVICVTFSLALVSLTLGLLVSGVARTPLQVIQFMLLLVVPQILLSGVFDLSQAPAWMQVLSQCLPITYGAQALRDVMLRGATLADIGGQLAVIWAFVVAFFLLATLSFMKRRTG